MELLDEEVLMLVHALYTHGNNIDRLAAALPDWSEEKIKLAITKFKSKEIRKKRKKKKKDLAFLEQWLSLVKDTHLLLENHDKETADSMSPSACTPKNRGHLISEVMLYAAVLENHPEPTSPSQPDYSEIYWYLYQLLSGQEPTQLRPGSAKKVLEMLKKVEQVAKKNSWRLTMGECFQATPPKFLRPTSMAQPSTSTTTPGPSEDTSGSSSVIHQENDDEDEDMQPRKDDSHSNGKDMNLLEKLEKKQMTSASSLIAASGFNIFGLSPYMLIKPPEVTMEGLNSHSSVDDTEDVIQQRQNPESPLLTQGVNGLSDKSN